MHVSVIDSGIVTIRTEEIAEMANDLGVVTFEGKTFRLMEVATLTNRVFHGWWGDASESEPEYTSEYGAAAEDDAGDPYKVIWQFDAVKGEEPEDEGNWPWDDGHITSVYAQ